MTSYVLERRQHVPRPPDEVFAFFADAHNLERITPDVVGFRILTPPPIRMAPGTLIDYRLRLWGAPVRWKTRIDVFEPDRCFVDVQLAGPYRRWVHRHTFEPLPGGTLVRDRVDYAMPFGSLGTLVHALVVRRTLEHIFDYRAERIAALLGPRA